MLKMRYVALMLVVLVINGSRVFAEVPVDLIGYGDRIYATYIDENDAGRFVHVLASADGKKWTTVSKLSPLEKKTPRYWYRQTPKFSVQNDQLMVVASAKEGKFVWSTKDGKNWDENPIPPPSSRIAWNQTGVGVYLSVGSICGSAQTITTSVGTSNGAFRRVGEQTVKGFFPRVVNAVFVGDELKLVITRRNSSPWDLGQLNASLVTSKAPYNELEWKETNLPLDQAKIIQTSDNRYLVVAKISDPDTRTAVFHIDIESGKLKELARLSVGHRKRPLGTAFHAGKLFCGYINENEEGKQLVVESLTEKQLTIQR